MQNSHLEVSRVYVLDHERQQETIELLVNIADLINLTKYLINVMKLMLGFVVLTY